MNNKHGNDLFPFLGKAARITFGASGNSHTFALVFRKEESR
jgi:hypothetical protein